MPKLPDREVQKQFGLKLLIVVVLIILTFSIWYFYDRNTVEPTPIEVTNEQRN
ncbi:hypothetical protein GF376_00725 [Candidatus Peregrinibacteria bacterium]|nr:hypothetical protein [Candidatus Peregrinibacteria bacterium]